MYLSCTIAVNSSIFLDYISFASHFPWSIFVFLYELNHFESGFQQWYASKRCTTQVSQRFMSTLMLLPIIWVPYSSSPAVWSFAFWSHIIVSVGCRTDRRQQQERDSLWEFYFSKLLLYSFQEPVTSCEFQEKPAEVTTCAKSLLVMQIINLLNLPSPCSLFRTKTKKKH